MKLVTRNEMQLLEERAINQYGIPGSILMENAGLAVVHRIKDFLPQLAGKKIVIFAGKGNNGGDGFVVARHLANAGCEVKVFLLCKPDELQNDAKLNWQILKNMNIRYQVVRTENDFPVVKIGLLHADLVVDAIFGTGFKGIMPETIGKVVDIINNAGKLIVAVDLPSGVDVDTGQVNGSCIKADATVTFGLCKLGLVLEPAARYVGHLTVGDISLPPAVVFQQQIRRTLLTGQWCQSKIPGRQIDSHKGTFGHVLVVGGSPGMSGAVTLAGMAALRAGAGLVTVAVPNSIHQVVAGKLMEEMIQPLPDTVDGVVGLAALHTLVKLSEQKVLVLGPGLSRHPESMELVRQLIKQVSCPMVLDADALFALADHIDVLKETSLPVVLTPHPGEIARIMKMSTTEVQLHRVEVAEKLALSSQVTVVLKGAKSLVAGPSGTLYVNSTGNPGMATGGAGDVLAGIIGAFLAQGISADDAAGCGVFLHGLAGDRGKSEKGEMGLTAGDLITYLPSILKEYEGK